MAYLCKVYFNTGFDELNIPDNPNLLEQCVFREFDALNIHQDKFLNSIRIKSTYEELYGADYIMVGNAYYAISNIRMLNLNTAELTLTPDYINSNGGISALTIESGWASRVCIPEYEDQLFAYTIEEDFTPNEPLQLSSPVAIIDTHTGTSLADEWTIIETTMQLEDLGQRYTENEDLDALAFKAPQYVTPEEGLINSVIVPQLPYAGTDTTTVGILWIGGDPPVVKSTNTPGIILFAAKGGGGDSTNLNAGITIARSCGVESSILNQYVIPEAYIDTVNTSFLADGGCRIVRFVANNQVKTINSLPFEYVSGIHNKKVFSGKANSYILCSNVSGNKTTCNPEDIATPTGDLTIHIMSDLRPNGKPWCFFEYYKGSYNSLMQLSCEGLEWQNAPLVYTDKSGNLLDRYNFESNQYQAAFNNGLSAITGLMNLSTGAISAAGTGNIGGLLSTMTGTANLLGSQTNYALNRQRDITNYTAQQNLVVPDVNFPKNEGLRDFFGNNFYLLRTRYSDLDARRFDRYLTMYGYKVSLPFTYSQLTSRYAFNYIQVGGVSLKYNNNTTFAYKTGAERQLEAGVRIWHVLPDTRFFDNGNKEEV